MVKNKSCRKEYCRNYMKDCYKSYMKDCYKSYMKDCYKMKKNMMADYKMMCLLYEIDYGLVIVNLLAFGSSARLCILFIEEFRSSYCRRESSRRI